MKNTMQTKTVCALAAIALGIGGCAEFSPVSQYEGTPARYAGSSYSVYNTYNGQLMQELVREQQRQRDMAQQEAEQKLDREQNDGPCLTIFDFIPGPWQLTKGIRTVKWLLRKK